MKKIYFITMLVILLLWQIPSFGQVTDVNTPARPSFKPEQNPARGLIVPAVINQTSKTGVKGELYNNGPFVTHIGAASNGGDVSASGNGYGINSATNQSISDDFTVTSSSWSVDSIVFYSYKTGSVPSPSPISEYHIRIYNGDPSTGGTIVWGDMTTNRLVNSYFTNCYRDVIAPPFNDLTRPIMHNTCATPGLTIPAGTYWVEFQATGTGAGTGPWANPMIIYGVPAAGNALSYDGASWSPAGGFDYPFNIYGSIPDLCTTTLPLTESFTAATMPTCWRTQNGAGLIQRWSISPANLAGGTANEARCMYQSIVGTTRLIAPPVNTVGLTQLNLDFKHLFDDYGLGMSCHIQTSTDSINWTNEVWTINSGGGNVGPATVSTTITTNLNSPKTYIAFVATGDLYQFDNWYIDDINITSGGVPNYLTVTPANQNVANTAGTTPFAVSSNIAWTAVSNQTWCTVTPNGTGDGTITATYTANTGVARTANITVSGPGVTDVIVTVSQAAGTVNSLSATPANQNVANTAGTTPFTVTSNISWTAVSNQTWCTVTPSGTGNGTITATFTANTGVARTANITVSGPGVTDVIVTVSQAAGTVNTLSVAPANQNVSSAAGAVAFAVTSNISWTAVSNQSWCLVTPSGTGNGSLSATYEANTGAARIASITVSGPGVTDVIVTVSQAAGTVNTLSVTPANQNVANTAGTTPFTVTSNISWTVVSNQTWCTVTPSGTGNGTITATFTANTGAARTANITVSGSGVTDVIVTVSQAAGTVNTLSVTPSNQNVSDIAGSTTFAVTSNISWTAVSNQTWCTVTPSGTGNGTITATFTANTGAARTANITVSGSGVTDVIVTVSQAAAGASFLNVTPANQNVTAPAGSTTFTVTSDTSWTVSCPQSWCTVTPASGLHNGTITANYTANTGVARVANITVTAPGLAPVIVTVTQAAGAANFMTVTPATQNVTFAAGSTSFTVSSSVSWTAVSNQTWCTITPASGTGNGSVTANYTANTGSERTATITFTGTGVPNVTVTVVQASFNYMTIAPDHQDVTSPAGITSFAVSSNTAWTVTSNQTWCTLNPAFGSGDVNVYAIYTANTATTQRTATLTFAGTGVSNKTVTVVQDGVPATLDVTPATSNITATAGIIHYTVTSNISWTAVSSQTWCTLSPASGNNNGSFNATVTANTGASRSATITISGGGATPVAVTINQDATGGPSVLTVDPTAANVTALPGSVSLNVSSNIAWTAVSSQTWANLTPLSGTGNGSVTVSYGMNTGTARTANITFSGAGVPDVIVPLNQDAPAPSITVTPIILADFGNVNASSFSSAQTYTLNGTALTGDITVTRPVSDFQISEDATDWSNATITVSPSAGAVSSKIIYVRFAPGSAGAKSGTINNASPGAVSKTVTANGNGTVSQPQITISATTLDLGIAKLTKNKYKHYQIQGAFLSDTILVSSSNTNFKLSLDSAGNVWTNSVVLNKPVGATVNPTIIYIRFTPATVGAINGLITHKCTGATQQTLAVTGTGEANAGVDEISATNQELIAYPNPSNGLFQIKYIGEDMNDVSLEIYTGKGAQIYLNNIRKIKDNENLTIDLAGATPGIYYIKLSSKKKVITRKIVVM